VCVCLFVCRGVSFDFVLSSLSFFLVSMRARALYEEEEEEEVDIITLVEIHFVQYSSGLEFFIFT
jgi:hypothetical protein